jgi:hypothetical protein
VRKRAAEHPRSQGQVCLSRFPTERSRERRKACSGKLQRSRASDQTAASVELHQNAARCGLLGRAGSTKPRTATAASFSCSASRARLTGALPIAPTADHCCYCCCCWLLRGASGATNPAYLVSIQRWQATSGGLPACLPPPLRRPCCDAADTDRSPPMLHTSDRLPPRPRSLGPPTVKLERGAATMGRRELPEGNHHRCQRGLCLKPINNSTCHGKCRA